MKDLEFIAEPGANYSLSFSTDGIDEGLPQNQEYLQTLSN